MLYQTSADSQLGISAKQLSNFKYVVYNHDKVKRITKYILDRIPFKNKKASVRFQKNEFKSSIKVLEAIIKLDGTDTLVLPKFEFLRIWVIPISR